MNKRIDIETDLNVLTDLAFGIPHKDIATKYGISVSYVSKLNNGKKKLNFHVIDSTTQDADTDTNDVIQYITECISEYEYKVYIYKKILNRLKGE